MEKLIRDILCEMRRGGVDERRLARLIRARNRERAAERESGKISAQDPAQVLKLVSAPTSQAEAGRKLRPIAKRDILPAYRAIEDADPGHWERLGVSARDEAAFAEIVRMKPRRTASGVATVSVVAKPWPCSGACAYCPNDIRMPKSYLADEPACQRAERAFFDPYLQVVSRLRALELMGHPTDKVELIVLGGSWDDYPEGYRVWFARELFRALNDAADEALLARACAQRRSLYEDEGIPSDPAACAPAVKAVQEDIDAGRLSYAEAWREVYGRGAWERLACGQHAAFEGLAKEHARNEGAAHRAVGLSFETRPDLVTAESLWCLRRLGATKVQMGVQCLDDGLLCANGRGEAGGEAIRRAFALLRAFGFKIHVHAMANLPGSTPERDVEDFKRLVDDPDFLPDEVKLYPCVLVAGTKLADLYEQKAWRPYSEDELVDVLATDLSAAPPFVRISRVVRDIPAPDIRAGNTRANLRQIVERRLEAAGAPVREIRSREIGGGRIDVDVLTLDVLRYETSIGEELFLQWVDPQGRIAGFLRLSLPDFSWVAQQGDAVPIRAGEAMIREVHVYGVAAEIGEKDPSAEGAPHAQHHGLGRGLVKHACELARSAGYVRIKVISAIGTRAYYRSLGFKDAGLYQQRELAESDASTSEA